MSKKSLSPVDFMVVALAGLLFLLLLMTGIEEPAVIPIICIVVFYVASNTLAGKQNK